MAGLRRALAVLLYGALCFYFLLPFRTPVPGLSTVTILKACGLLLSLASLASMFGGRYRRAFSALAKRYWPLPVLALLLLVVSATRTEARFLEVKLLSGFALGVWVMVALAVELADPAVRSRAVVTVVVGGILSAVAGLVEPFTVGGFDRFWSLFRPNLEVFDPVLGREAGVGLVHWEGYGSIRISGLFSDPNHLANFLDIWFPLLAFLVLIRKTMSGTMRAVVAVLATVGALALSGTLTRSAVVACGGAAALVTVLLALDRVPRRRSSGRGRAAVFCAAAASAVALAVQGLTAAGIAMAGSAFLAVMLVFALLERKEVTGTGPGRRRLLLTVGGLGLVALVALPLSARFQSSAASYRLAGQPASDIANWRVGLWKCAARAIREHPLAGRGYTAFYGDISREFKGFYSGVSNPHNLYLTAWVTGGVLALGLLLHFLVMVLARAWRMVRTGTDEARALGAVMIWYWVAYVLLGVVGQDPFPVDEALIFGAWGALAVAPMGLRKKA